MNSDVSSKSLKLSEAKPMNSDVSPKSLKIGRHRQKMPQYVPSGRKKHVTVNAGGTIVFLRERYERRVFGIPVSKNPSEGWMSQPIRNDGAGRCSSSSK